MARLSARIGMAGMRLAMLVAAAVVAGVLVAGLALPVTGALGLVGRAGAQSFESLPDDLQTPPPPERSRILDARGGTIAQFYYENRISVPLAKIAPIMRKAIVAIEDSRFYQHGGVDLRGTARAFVNNQTGESIQGGSTLTQQYVKLVQQESALARGDEGAAREAVVRSGTQGYARKLREMRYAVALEERLSKDEILERYLNIAYFGSGAYGVEAASRHYFARSAAQLNLPQAALLAGVVQSPGTYDPTINPDLALQRRNTVLARMADPEVGAISPAQAETSRASALGVKEAPTRNGCSSAVAAFFCDYVVNVIKEDPAFGATPQDRQRVLLRGGLTVTTTLDPKRQAAAQEAVDTHIPRNDSSRLGTASVVVQPGTGRVLAMAQNRTWGEGPKRGYTQINYAVDERHGGSKGFQAGSTFKVFTAATAIGEGIPISRRITATSPMTFYGFKDCDGRRRAPYTTSNSTRSGVFDMRDGLAYSVNTWAVGLEEMVSQCAVVDTAEAMGMHRADGRPMNRFPSFTLGTEEIAPLTLAESYATLAARGKHCPAYPLLDAVGRDGKRIKLSKPACRQAIPKDVADGVNYLTRGVVDFGTGSRMRLDRPTAGKTGTTSDNYDVWFAGYTPNMAGVVWVGDPGRNVAGRIVRQKMRNIVINGTRVSAAAGSTVAGPIWKDTMSAAVSGLPKLSFRSPDPSSVRGAPVRVPDVRGQSRASAIRELQQAGLSWRVSSPRVTSSSISAGDVAYTSPRGGNTAYSDETVTIYISAGEAPSPRASSTPEPKPTATPKAGRRAAQPAAKPAAQTGGTGGPKGKGPKKP